MMVKIWEWLKMISITLLVISFLALSIYSVTKLISEDVKEQQQEKLIYSHIHLDKVNVDEDESLKIQTYLLKYPEGNYRVFVYEHHIHVIAI